jgi:hypothetical protein
LVTNCTRGYKIRCTLIIRAVERASRKKRADIEHVQKILALCLNGDELQDFGIILKNYTTLTELKAHSTNGLR